MGRAQRYALIQSQVLYWALMVVAVYLIATRLSVAAALGIVAFQLVCYAAVLVKITRDSRRHREHDHHGARPASAGRVNDEADVEQ